MYFINFTFKAYKRNKYDSCADYKFENADWKNLKDICKYITPVPRGVDPMTVTMLLYNTMKAWLCQNKLLKRNIDIIIENNSNKDNTVNVDTDSPPG